MGREGPWHSEAFPSPLNKDSFWSVIAKQLAIHRQGGTTPPPGLAPGHEECAWCMVHGVGGSPFKGGGVASVSPVPVCSLGKLHAEQHAHSMHCMRKDERLEQA